MLALRFLLLFCAIFALSACSSDSDVYDVQFGRFTRTTASLKFTADSTIQKSDETKVGWAFSMRNLPASLTVTEIIEGPVGTIWEAPSGAKGVYITEGGRVATVKTVFSNPNSPFLFHNWAITKSDPVGKYKATLVIDGKEVKRANFFVVE